MLRRPSTHPDGFIVPGEHIGSLTCSLCSALHPVLPIRGGIWLLWPRLTSLLDHLKDCSRRRSSDHVVLWLIRTFRCGPQSGSQTAMTRAECPSSRSPPKDFHPISSRPCRAYTRRCTPNLARRLAKSRELRRWPSIKLTNLIDHIIVIRNNIDGGFDMQTVTVSPKYQVVIPKAVREALHLRPGQKMQVLEYDGRIELIPERDIKELRGFLKGINTEFEREEDRV